MVRIQIVKNKPTVFEETTVIVVCKRYRAGRRHQKIEKKNLLWDVRDVWKKEEGEVMS